jgi:hypothetical protein
MKRTVLLCLLYDQSLANNDLFQNGNVWPNMRQNAQSASTSRRTHTTFLLPQSVKTESEQGAAPVQVVNNHVNRLYYETQAGKKRYVSYKPSFNFRPSTIMTTRAPPAPTTTKKVVTTTARPVAIQNQYKYPYRGSYNNVKPQVASVPTAPKVNTRGYLPPLKLGPQQTQIAVQKIVNQVIATPAPVPVTAAPRNLWNSFFQRGTDYWNRIWHPVTSAPIRARPVATTQAPVYKPATGNRQYKPYYPVGQPEAPIEYVPKPEAVPEPVKTTATPFVWTRKVIAPQPEPESSSSWHWANFANYHLGTFKTHRVTSDQGQTLVISRRRYTVKKSKTENLDSEFPGFTGSTVLTTAPESKP